MPSHLITGNFQKSSHKKIAVPKAKPSCERKKKPQRCGIALLTATAASLQTLSFSPSSPRSLPLSQCSRGAVLTRRVTGPHIRLQSCAFQPTRNSRPSDPRPSSRCSWLCFKRVQSWCLPLGRRCCRHQSRNAISYRAIAATPQCKPQTRWKQCL